ncbi:MAG: T9SS type A sorting domain-containing protein [Bacteroidetes bacterium]|nr:T9SS type A sorting domain-containing protein [Bacteroidota bacterium]
MSKPNNRSFDNQDLRTANQAFSHIEIYNSMGDLVISTWIENNSYLLDMTTYNQGIYFIRCMDQSRKYHTKSFNLLK